LRWKMVEQLVEMDPGKRAAGKKTFSPSDFFFAEHFPGRPVVPGVLQIEMIAQMAGICIRRARPGYIPVLVRVRSARFTSPVGPGQECLIRAEIQMIRPAFAVATGSVEVGERKTAEAEIMFAMLKIDESLTKGADVERYSMEAGLAAPAG